MPTYSFENTDTGEVQTHIMSLAEREDYLKNNPHIKQLLSTFSIGDSVRLGIRKTDDSFQDLLKNAKKGNRNNTIQTRT